MSFSFTHICEWNICSLSSAFAGSSGWIVAVVIVVVGSASMIRLIPLFSELDFESDLAPFLWSREPMIVLREIYQCCARGFFGKHTTFQCCSSSSHDPSFLVAWTSFWEVFVRNVFIILWLLPICRPELSFVLVPKFMLDFDIISIGNSQWWDV